ncbi:MAG: acyl-CoA/acyl-ACP dehydrogenase [Actinomycetia bacterium]|nr:acyl-CoA/acyl-ACP dehydrogenase [Actinomycetes bacterium]
MDFTRTEAAQDLSGLIDTIVDAVCTPEHQRDLDRLDQRVDEKLWRALTEADVLSAAAPEAIGGGGFGVLEQAAILTALGRQLAAVPYLESVVLAAGAIAEFGSAELQQSWAVPAVAGTKVVTVALDGELGQGPVQATASADGFRLTGTRTQVPFGPVADGFLVPAETDSGTVVFLVAADDPSVSVTAQDTTGHTSAGELDLSGVEVPADRVVGDAEVLAWLTTRRAVGLAAFQLGVLERALALTAEYARTREQFDRPIGSFQAVSQRLADDYIDIKGLRLTCEQASWRLSEGLPAEVEAATAAFWAAEAGHRVAHSTVHIHGGVGIDVDHPVHRYFIIAKQTEFALGGATAALRIIGRDLADTPA